MAASLPLSLSPTPPTPPTRCHTYPDTEGRTAPRTSHCSITCLSLVQGLVTPACLASDTHGWVRGHLLLRNRVMCAHVTFVMQTARQHCSRHSGGQQYDCLLQQGSNILPICRGRRLGNAGCQRRPKPEVDNVRERGGASAMRVSRAADNNGTRNIWSKSSRSHNFDRPF
ncbi:hypothetical protein E2C01_011771 [Portunus trituberculatus]|uniref:Uncharacterized protein n=1 Tax=Portunus trituberculatus TaxID=210409 RepID=A0A5B7DCR2_PORTR|nr:hypothetical protein [Portunus trituberculatus]